MKFGTLMVALLDLGLIAIYVIKMATPTLSSATIRVPNFKKLRSKIWLADVEKLSPVHLKIIVMRYNDLYNRPKSRRIRLITQSGLRWE